MKICWIGKLLKFLRWEPSFELKLGKKRAYPSRLHTSVAKS